MPCTVKKTLETAKKNHCDVLVQVKRNQPSLHDQLLAYAASRPVASGSASLDHGRRNRIERRKTHIWALPEGLLDADWSSLKTLIRVERKVDTFDPRQQAWRSRQETSWYVCTRVLTEQQAATLVRGHWSIENGCHHVRDVSLHEDASRIRMNPGLFAQLRTWTLNCLRQAGHRNIKAAREVLGWDIDQLLTMFSCRANC